MEQLNNARASRVSASDGNQVTGTRTVIGNIVFGGCLALLVMLVFAW